MRWSIRWSSSTKAVTDWKKKRKKMRFKVPAEDDKRAKYHKTQWYVVLRTTKCGKMWRNQRVASNLCSSALSCSVRKANYAVGVVKLQRRLRLPPPSHCHIAPDLSQIAPREPRPVHTKYQLPTYKAPPLISLFIGLLLRWCTFGQMPKLLPFYVNTVYIIFCF